MLLFFFARKILSLSPLYVHVRTCEPLLLITVIHLGDRRCLGGVWIVPGLERQNIATGVNAVALAALVECWFGR
ncbi:hypothetical protein C7A12_18170 [Pseudomonas fluorescens]|nr:hypothetical protein C7A12_18170 [Pseudomonas fluorescens]PRW76720.1 hypothetical protein C7A13_17780 [Pseudomonas fluorescens]